MKSFLESAQSFSACCQTKQARLAYLIATPLLILSLMIVLGFVKIIIPNMLGTNLAFVTTLVVLIYYFRLNWQLALGTTLIFVILLWIAGMFSYHGPTKSGLLAFIITAVLGGASLFYAHVKEGKSSVCGVGPCQLLVLPLYLTAELFFMAGLMKSLKEQIRHPGEPKVKKEPTHFANKN